MSNKLQELTERLYTEGLSKGKEEGEALLAKAQKEADEIIANAKAEAKLIMDQAEKSAADLKAKVEGDIRMASSQSLQATKKALEDLLVGAVCSDKVAAISNDADYMKEIISELVSKFNESEELKLIVSESLKAELEVWLQAELAAKLNKGITVEFSKKIRGGFTVGPKDGNWYLSFTDESFKALIAEYLRPLTAKILFAQ